jgi:hypothetical protein
MVCASRYSHRSLAEVEFSLAVLEIPGPQDLAERKQRPGGIYFGCLFGAFGWK